MRGENERVCLKGVCLGAVQKQHVKASGRACLANRCNDGVSFLWECVCLYVYI